MTEEADDDAQAAEQHTPGSADDADSEQQETGAAPAGVAEDAAAGAGDEAAEQVDDQNQEQAQAKEQNQEQAQGQAQGQNQEKATEQNQEQAQERPREESEGSVVERIAAHDEELAAAVSEELEANEKQLQAKEAEIEELEEKLARKQADFQNFKKRQRQKLADQVARATEDLVERLLPVRDNLARALEQDADTDIREGVEGTLRELDRVLADEGVETIEPDRGDEPDPERHEVMMRVESDQPEGTVEELYRPGYEMADRVIRTAQVTVSDGE